MRALAVPLLLLALAGGAAAQTTPALALGVDAGPAFPLGAFADDGAQVGWSASASATLRIIRPLGVSVSVEHASFGLDDDAAAVIGEDRWNDTGVGIGVRAWLPVRSDARLQPWGQLGVGWHNLDAPIAGPQFGQMDTDWLFTLEGNGGVDIALPRRGLFIRPAARYRRYSFELETIEGTEETSISHLTVALGIVVVFARPSPEALAP